MLSTLEKKLKIDARYFVKNSFWLTFRHFVTTALGIITGMIFARYVSKETFGSYQLALSFMAAVTFFSLPGFGKAIWADASTGNDGSLRMAFSKQVKWAFLGSLALMVLASRYYFIGDVEFAWSLVAIAVVFPLYSGAGGWTAFLISKNMYGLSTKLILMAEIASKTAIIAAIFLCKASLLFIVIATVGMTAITNLIGSQVAKRKATNNNVSKDFVSYGFFVTKTAIIQGVLEKIDSILIGVFIGPAQLAIYAFALIIPQQLMNFVSALMDVIIPKLGEKSAKEINVGIGQKYVVLLLMNVILITAVILVTPFAVQVLFTENYTDSIIYAQIITASLFLYVFETFYSRFFLVKKYKDGILKTNLINPIFRSVVITLAFIWFGMLGVAASHTITRLFNVVMYMFLARKTQ